MLPAEVVEQLRSKAAHAEVAIAPLSGIMPGMVRDILELGGSLGFLDEMYDQFQAQPVRSMQSWHDVLTDGRWRRTGRATATPRTGRTGTRRTARTATNGHVAIGLQAPSRRTTGTTRAMPTFARPGAVTMSPIAAQTQPSVWPLVNAYRSRGHFAANLDPLGLARDRAHRRARAGDLGLHRAPTSIAIDRADRRPRPAARDARRGRRAPAHDLRGLGRASSSCTSRRRRGGSWLAERMETALATPRADGRPHAHARAADQRRAVRAVLPHQVPRHEAVLARGQRER